MVHGLLHVDGWLFRRPQSLSVCVLLLPIRTIQPDSKVGRELMNAVASVPDVSAEEFEASLNKGLHDLLMVHYLGSLTQSQICFWQRMQTMV